MSPLQKNTCWKLSANQKAYALTVRVYAGQEVITSPLSPLRKQDSKVLLKTLNQTLPGINTVLTRVPFIFFPSLKTTSSKYSSMSAKVNSLKITLSKLSFTFLLFQVTLY